MRHFAILQEEALASTERVSAPDIPASRWVKRSADPTPQHVCAAQDLSYTIRSVATTFHLIDLVSQCAAVERFLAASSEDEKIAWLSARGRLQALPMSHGHKQVYQFTATTGLEALFFLSDGLFVFVGDHTTFRPHWAAEQS